VYRCVEYGDASIYGEYGACNLSVWSIWLHQQASCSSCSSYCGVEVILWYFGCPQVYTMRILLTCLRDKQHRHDDFEFLCGFPDLNLVNYCDARNRVRASPRRYTMIGYVQVHHRGLSRDVPISLGHEVKEILSPLCLGPGHTSDINLPKSSRATSVHTALPEWTACCRSLLALPSYNNNIMSFDASDLSNKCS
jgi:hypothetical protein